MISAARSRSRRSSAPTLGRRSALARKPERERAWAPTITLSRTGMVRNMARFWKVRPRPSSAMPWLGSSPIDRPSNRISPAWNG